MNQRTRSIALWAWPQRVQPGHLQHHRRTSRPYRRFHMVVSGDGSRPRILRSPVPHVSRQSAAGRGRLLTGVHVGTAAPVCPSSEARRSVPQRPVTISRLLKHETKGVEGAPLLASFCLVPGHGLQSVPGHLLHFVVNWESSARPWSSTGFPVRSRGSG